ncbi:MAG: methylase [Acidimicrobiales bacterium]|nr:methylase [Acidimicrobiales bacterium]
MPQPERPAHARLHADYQRIMANDYRQRWDGSNVGNREMAEERDRLLTSMTAGVVPDRPLRVLDVGCGNLSVLPGSIRVDVRIGIDLLMHRLVVLRANDDTPTVNGDGAFLPFPDATFDVVVMSTMMTSVLDDSIRRRVAHEVERALRPGGALLWYDMRMPNPRNRATRAIGRSELRSLFPILNGETRSLTVVPFVARRLGRFSSKGYAVLRRMPFLRAHLVACLVKPS